MGPLFTSESHIMIPTIYYEKEAYSLGKKQIMGRQAAGDSFLKGLFNHYQGEEVWFYGNCPNNLNSINETGKKVALIEREKSPLLAKSGLLYFPSPDIGRQAYLRASTGVTCWSICGITHTTSSDRVMDALAENIVAPTRPWDAIICTSEAVKQHCNKVISAQLDYLKYELGLTKISLPRFPVIPLGVNVNDFGSKPGSKSKTRKKYKISSDEIVVLYLGRLSFHAKGHPFQLYKSLGFVSKKADAKICLVECGWFANDYIKDAFDEVFNVTCGNAQIRRIFVDGTNQLNKADALSMADLFVSLSDNIQETFGITPIEAMASGLPVVVSDWNGYKETVTKEVGYKVPTTIPTPGLGTDLINRYATAEDNYDQYLGKVSALISVDQQELNSVLGKLISDPELRHNVGKRARKWVEKNYDWSIIIEKYHALWRELSDIRQREAKIQKVNARKWPARLEPFVSFQHYGSKTLALTQKVQVTIDVEKDRDAEIRALCGLKVFSYNLPSFAKVEDIIELIVKIETIGSTIEDILSNYADSQRPYVFRLLFWLLKANLIEVANDDSSQND